MLIMLRWQAALSPNLLGLSPPQPCIGHAFSVFIGLQILTARRLRAWSRLINVPLPDRGAIAAAVERRHDFARLEVPAAVGLGWR
ncbi:MAG: hypothetical protein GY759_10320 [Chloroflexi bacterium]|nr:hypothetical protein [Chloroflexota bacterium]